MNKKRGYSLIELSVVIALLGMTCLLAINMYGYLHRALTRNDLERLYVTMKYLQQRAKTRHESQLLVFDVSKQSYQWGDVMHHFSTATGIDILPDVKGPPSDPKQLITKPISFKENRIEFYADGTIDAGSIYVVNHKDRQLYALTCGIGGSSYIRLYRYDSPTWHVLAVE